MDFESEHELILLSCPRAKSLKKIVTDEELQRGPFLLASRGLEAFLVGSFCFVVNLTNLERITN